MKSWITAVTAATLAILAGCSGGGEKQEQVVAQAGDIKVTLADFQDAYNRITENFRPDISTLEGRRAFANDLLNKEIMLAEARRMGGVTDPQILEAVNRNRDSKMMQVLYRNEVESKVDVLGKDVAEVYDHLAYNVRASHILLESMEEAQRVRDEIASGKISFEDAARKYSLDRGTRDNGGSIGEFKWSLALPEVQRRAFDLEPGTISEPFETDLGVHILRVEERVPQELPPLEDMRPQLRTDVRRQLEQLRMREYVGELEERAGLAWNDEGLALLRRLIDEESKLDVDTIPAERQYIPHADEQQRAVALATYGGKTATIGDYLDFLATQPGGNRPVTAPPTKALRQLVRSTFLDNQILMAEAFRLGLDKNEEIEGERERLLERILVEQVHSRFTQAADVPIEDARALYDSTKTANPDALMMPERVDMVILVHTDSSVVAQGLARIRAGEDEAKVVSELTMDFRTTPKGGRTGMIARGNYAPQIEEVAFTRKPSEGWSRPIVTQSGTGALRVIAHEEPRMATFEEVEETLVNQLARQRGEEAFEKWLQEQRDSLGVEIHDDVLELYGQPVS